MFDFVKSIKSWAHECTPALFAQVINSKEVGEICAEIADAHEKCLRGEMSREDYKTFKAERKKALPGFTFQAHYENGGRRLDKNAIRSGLCIYDKDHVSDPHIWYQEHIGDHAQEWGIVLAHVTPSGEGVRLVFRIADKVSLADAQWSLARLIGDKDYDGSVKDLARVSFAVPADYMMMSSFEELFKPTPSDYVMPFKIYRASASVLKKNQATGKKKKTRASSATSEPAKRWKCHRPTPRTIAIFERAMKKRNITTAAFAIEGQRHFMMVNLLSTGITRILTKEELMGAIRKYAPTYSREADCWQLVADWYENYRNDNKPVSQDMAWTFADVLNLSDDGNESKEEEEKQLEESEKLEEEEQKNLDNPSNGFTMNIDDLPIGLKESLLNVPTNLTMPVLCSIMPLAGAYADMVDVRYADGKMHHLGLMSIIVGEQASKKSACKDVVDVWKQSMYEDDSAQRKIEDEWKQRRKNRKANERGEPDPQVLIREIPVTTSCSTLLKRFKNSKGHCLYSFGEELDTLRKTNGAGSWSSKYDIYRLSFDRGEWGQDYNSDQAESGIVRVAYNWTILGTYGALKKCFKADNIENGLSSRVIIAEMPDNRFAPMTTFNDVQETDSESIQKAVEILRSTTGFIDTPRLRDAMSAWVEEKTSGSIAGHRQCERHLSQACRRHRIPLWRYLLTSCRWRNRPYARLRTDDGRIRAERAMQDIRR
jgi:hypothetical protein